MQRNESNGESSAIPTVSPLINDEEKLSIQAELNQAGFDDGQNVANALYRAGFKHGQRATLAFLQQQALEEEQTPSLDDTVAMVDSSVEEEELSDVESTSSTETLNTSDVIHHSDLNQLLSVSSPLETKNSAVLENEAKEPSHDRLISANPAVDLRGSINHSSLREPFNRQAHRSYGTSDDDNSTDEPDALFREESSGSISTPPVARVIISSTNNQNQATLSREVTQPTHDLPSSAPSSNDFSERLMNNQQDNSDGSHTDRVRGNLEIEQGNTPVTTSTCALVVRSVANEMWWLASLLWPAAFYGILTHDALKFYFVPENRYDTTEKNVWLGLPLSDPLNLGNVRTNQDTLLNYLGTDVVPDTKATLDAEAILAYWGPVSGIMAFSIFAAIAPIAYYMTKRCFSQPHVVQSEDSEDPLVSNPAAPQHNSSTLRKRLFWTVFAAIIALPDIRIAGLFIQKWAETTKYWKGHDECPDVYAYLKEVQAYICSKCGHWKDRPPQYLNQIYTDQGCLDAVLSKKIDPVSFYGYLQKLNLFNIHHFDISRQAFSSWSNNIATQILKMLSKESINLDVFNFSEDENNFDLISMDKINAVTNLVSIANVSTLISNNQNLGAKIGSAYIYGLQNSSVTRFISRNCQLGSIEPNAFEELFAKSKISFADISENYINDLIFIYILNGMIKSGYLRGFLVDDNKLSSTSVIRLMKKINQTLIEELGIAGIEAMNTAAATAIGDAISTYPLKGLNIARCNLGSPGTLALAPGLSKSLLEMLDYSDNFLSDPEAAYTFMQSLPPSLRSLILARVGLSDDGMRYLALYLLSAPLTDLNIYQNKFSLTGWKAFVLALATSKVQKFNAGMNGLDDDANNALADAIRNKTISLKVVKLDENKLNDDSTLALIISFGNNTLDNIVLSKNPLTDKFCIQLATLIPDNRFRFIDLSGTSITGACPVNMIRSTPRNSIFEGFKANNIQYTNQDYFDIIKQLLYSRFDLSFLKDNVMDKDATRALVEDAKPATSISHIEILADETKFDLTGYGPQSITNGLPETFIHPRNFSYSTPDFNARKQLSQTQFFTNHATSSSIDESTNSVLFILLALAIMIAMWKAQQIARSLIQSRHRLFSTFTPALRPVTVAHNDVEARQTTVLRK